MFVSFTFEPTERLKSLREKYGLRYPGYRVESKDCIRLNRRFGFPTLC